jgi:hypothetical protein
MEAEGGEEATLVQVVYKVARGHPFLQKHFVLGNAR